MSHKIIDWKKCIDALRAFIEAFTKPSEMPSTGPTSPVEAPSTPTPSPTQPPVPEPVPSAKFINALIQVESGGDDMAIGDKHLANKAYGCLQIRKPYLDDVNRLWGTILQPKDMLGNRELSIKVTRAYINHYCTEKRIGRPVTDQDRARIHNGGPDGWKKASTVGYWAKVQKVLSA